MPVSVRLRHALSAATCAVWLTNVSSTATGYAYVNPCEFEYTFFLERAQMRLQGDQLVTLPYSCRRSKIRGVVLSCGAALSAVAALSSAATDAVPALGADVDYGALNRDLTLTRSVDGRLTIVMWMPDEFWRASLQNSGRITEQGIAQYIAVIHPYMLVAVLDAQRGITAFRYTDMDTLVSEVTIEDAQGMKYSPLPPDSIAEDMKNLIQIFRPLLSNMMGAMGQHMEILVFASLDKAGHLIADPKKDGSLTVHLSDISMRYRLPLGGMLPPSLDAKTGESFPGSYHFNPYTGSKLVQKPSDTHAGSTPKPQ